LPADIYFLPGTCWAWSTSLKHLFFAIVGQKYVQLSIQGVTSAI